MAAVIFAGGGMPLQKVLEAAVKVEGITIAMVFTDLGHDGDIERFCSQRKTPTADIALLKRTASAQPELPEHEWFFSVNATVIFSGRVLAAPTKGALNMHPGRLPDYAGLHTHQWAIRNGETEFASTLHWMTEALDAGPVAFVNRFPIKAKETGLSLFLKCLSAGAALVVQALEYIAQGKALPRTPQDLSRRHLYRAADAKQGTIDWRQDAIAIERFVRAADYGPLVCPTYKPTTYWAGQGLSIHKVEATDERLDGQPGTVARVAPGAITVRAGDGRAVIITKYGGDRTVAVGGQLT
jgi:methionyl-tRNA formyltransferase